jgi:hypothetical protein
MSKRLAALLPTIFIIMSVPLSSIHAESRTDRHIGTWIFVEGIGMNAINLNPPPGYCGEICSYGFQVRCDNKHQYSLSFFQNNLKGGAIEVQVDLYPGASLLSVQKITASGTVEQKFDTVLKLHWGIVTVPLTSSEVIEISKNWSAMAVVGHSGNLQQDTANTIHVPTSGNVEAFTALASSSMCRSGTYETR